MHHLCFPRANKILPQPCPNIITRHIVRLRLHAVLDLRTRRIIHGDHVAGRRRNRRGATCQAHVDKVTNAKGTAADRAVRETGVVYLDRCLNRLRVYALVY
jgi:hypothetical protein